MMRRLSPVSRSLVLAACATLLYSTAANASHLRHGPTSGKSHKSKHTQAVKTVSARPRAMDDARAAEIQTALVKAGYLESASGHWDDTSASAMRKLQGDNGWQTKLIPDSRALIKLGLGPGSEPAGSTGVSSLTGNPQAQNNASLSDTGAAQK